MEAEINLSELLDNCVRCHKSDSQLKQYTIRKDLGVRRGNAKYYKINYSICETCKPHLEKGLELEDKLHSFKFKTTLSMIYLVIYTVSLIIFFMSNPPLPLGGILIAILVGGTLGSFCLILNLRKARYKAHPKNINRYFEIKNDGTVILKDLENKSKVSQIDILAVEQLTKEVLPEETYTFCPNCGSQIKTYTGFCQSCGKNLKKS